MSYLGVFVTFLYFKAYFLRQQIKLLNVGDGSGFVLVMTYFQRFQIRSNRIFKSRSMVKLGQIRFDFGQVVKNR